MTREETIKHIRYLQGEYMYDDKAVLACDLAIAALGAQAWRPIETAPDLTRILVCGWRSRSGHVAGYWWWHEDAVADGKAIEHPDALYWTPIVLPPFPTPPENK